MFGIVTGIGLVLCGVTLLRNGYLTTDGSQLFMGLVCVVMGIISIVVQGNM